MKTTSIILAVALALWGTTASAKVDCENVRTTDRCGVCAVYHEARGETLLGQYAAAQVILNRVESKRFPNTVCEVVWQAGNVKRKNPDGTIRRVRIGQFSFTTDGLSDRMKDEQSVAIATFVWDTVNMMRDTGLDEQWIGLGRDVLFYHTPAVNPSWSRAFTKVKQIGSHIFYRYP